ncbi:luc7-like protein 3 [Osmerus mordax]|uniref:luc7-like protein 3 n=1 Tax=Osmerus mordax TaxID=8014 RepID=UPI00350F9BEF
MPYKRTFPRPSTQKPKFKIPRWILKLKETLNVEEEEETPVPKTCPFIETPWLKNYHIPKLPKATGSVDAAPSSSSSSRRRSRERDWKHSSQASPASLSSQKQAGRGRSRERCSKTHRSRLEPSHYDRRRGREERGSAASREETSRENLHQGHHCQSSSHKRPLEAPPANPDSKKIRHEQHPQQSSEHLQQGPDSQSSSHKRPREDGDSLQTHPEPKKIRQEVST